MKFEFRLGTVILAAGASTRMGCPKMLLPWGTTSVIGHVIALWKTELQAAQVAVVTSPSPSPVAEELDRLAFPPSDRIVNPHPERGMFSSIQTAAAWPGWLSDITHFALILGDQPQITATTLEALLRSARERPTIYQPSRNHRPKHPIIFPAGEFRDIAESKCETLREHLEQKERILVEMDESSLEVDLDCPADYEAAVKLANPISSR